MMTYPLGSESHDVCLFPVSLLCMKMSKLDSWNNMCYEHMPSKTATEIVVGQGRGSAWARISLDTHWTVQKNDEGNSHAIVREESRNRLAASDTSNQWRVTTVTTSTGGKMSGSLTPSFKAWYPYNANSKFIIRDWSYVLFCCIFFCFLSNDRDFSVAFLSGEGKCEELTLALGPVLWNWRHPSPTWRFRKITIGLCGR